MQFTSEEIAAFAAIVAGDYSEPLGNRDNRLARFAALINIAFGNRLTPRQSDILADLLIATEDSYAVIGLRILEGEAIPTRSEDYHGAIASWFGRWDERAGLDLHASPYLGLVRQLLAARNVPQSDPRNVLQLHFGTQFSAEQLNQLAAEIYEQGKWLDEYLADIPAPNDPPPDLQRADIYESTIAEWVGKQTNV